MPQWVEAMRPSNPSGRAAFTHKTPLIHKSTGSSGLSKVFFKHRIVKPHQDRFTDF